MICFLLGCLIGGGIGFVIALEIIASGMDDDSM